MTRSRLRVPAGLAIILLLFPFTSLAAAAVSSPASVAVPSPLANAELICHTDNPAECYPKVFSPTEEFQVIHEDQDLPPGLHVRMNIWTGEKEARLNIPSAEDAALEGLPIDRSVIVVESEDFPEPPRIPLGAPSYEPEGVVKEPPIQDPDFAVALEFLKKHAETAPSHEHHPLDDALIDLEDVSHDIYYGKKITEDAGALKALFCLLTQRDEDQVAKRALSERRDFLASSILSSALQNNPHALRNVESHWNSIMHGRCATNSRNVETALRDVFFADIEPHPQWWSPGVSTLAYVPDATWVRTSLPVLGRLLKSDLIRPQFMEKDGMKHLLKILLTRSDEWEAARVRAARIVSDNFLDESVGAKLGVWPLNVASHDEVCKKDDTMLDEGCWEYHLKSIISRRTENTEWAQDLLGLLQQRRPGFARIKDEL